LVSINVQYVNTNKEFILLVFSITAFVESNSSQRFTIDTLSSQRISFILDDRNSISNFVVHQVFSILLLNLLRTIHLVVSDLVDLPVIICIDSDANSYAN